MCVCASVCVSVYMYVYMRERESPLWSSNQVETVLEEFEVYEPISLIVGSSAGGLLVLALITAALYKVRCRFPIILTLPVCATSSAVHETG